MGASRRRILLRRAVALLLGVGVAVAAMLLFVADSDEPRSSGQRPTKPVSPEVRERLGGLSVEQKVDLVMAVGFEGTDATSPIFATIAERELGGILVGPGNWLDPVQGGALVAELRASGQTGGRLGPLLIARQEGGPYRTLAGLPPARRQVEIGDLGDPAAAERWAAQTASEMAAVGFDLNLAPVADVASLYTPIADRSFGEDPELAAQMTAAAVRGCSQAGLACAPAHFPGQGSASQDTAAGPATVQLFADQLLARDLAPFRAAFAAGAPATVLSHSFFAAYDPVTPASQTPAIATSLLRNRLGFDGVAITDDLGAGAIRALGNPPRAAVASIAAGADMVLIEAPGRVQEGVRSALLRAARGGAISRSRLDQAAGRVLELKRSRRDVAA